MRRSSRRTRRSSPAAGMKGVALPDDFMDVITEFLGVDRIQVGYGFSEVQHLPLGLRGRPLPRGAVGHSLRARSRHQRATAAHRSCRPAARPSTTSCSRAHWGGVISGDEVTIDWDLAVPVWPDQRRVRERHRALQRKEGRRGRPHHLRGNTRGAERGGRLHEGCRPVSSAYTVPLFLRGEIITDDLVAV